MDGPNLYTYVRQNPWTYFDPTGLYKLHITENVYMDLSVEGAQRSWNDTKGAISGLLDFAPGIGNVKAAGEFGAGQTLSGEPVNRTSEAGWTIGGMIVGKGIANIVEKGVDLVKGLFKSARTNAEEAGDTVSLFHKGELKDGKVTNERSLNTTQSRESAEGYVRDGEVHEFEVPGETYREWEDDGLVQPFKDNDLPSARTVDDAVEVKPPAAEKLNEFKKTTE